MNATKGSALPIVKALITLCSLGLMSAFVWYSHVNAQSKSVLISGSKSKTVSATVKSEAPAPPTATQPPVEQQRTILLSGSKSWTGSTTLNSGTIAQTTPAKPATEPANPPILMSGSKVGLTTTTIAPPTPAPSTIHQPPKDQQPAVLMSGSKTLILTTTPTTLGATESSQKSPEPKADGKQPNQQTQSNVPGAKQTSGDTTKPPVPKDVLMFGSKAPAMPIVGTERPMAPPPQQPAPPVVPEKSKQK